MADRPCKGSERHIALALGGVRVANNGQAGPDVLADRFAIEVRTRRSLPASLWDAVAQARANAEDTTPVLMLVIRPGRQGPVPRGPGLGRIPGRGRR